MADSIDANIVNEVESRLEDLFGGDVEDNSDESGASPGPVESSTDAGEISFELTEDTPQFEDVSSEIEDAPVLEVDDGDFEDSPLKELKSTVLSIDWEISDNIMVRFLDQVEELRNTYANDKIIQMFLQLLFSVGKYIKAKKESSDPDVVRLLNSTYASLEKVILNQGLTEKEKKKLILNEINKFKQIKEKLGGKPADAQAGEVGSPSDLAIENQNTLTEEETTEEIESTTEEALTQEEDRNQIEESSSIPSKTRGFGLATKMSFILFVPLMIIVAFGYIYVRQISGIPFQVDQMIQLYIGVPVENAGNIVLATLGGLIVLLGLIATAYCSALAAKLKYLTQIVNQLSAGETVPPVIVKSTGEVGALGKAIDRFRENMS